jgi:flagellar basal-body rod protein FlgG
MQALWVAKTGLDAQQTRMSVISNNLANVNTTGFKRARASFEDLAYQNVRQVGGSTSQDTQDPSGMSIGTGSRIVSTDRQFTQGAANQTNGSLDIMIQGRGFFQVLMPDGDVAYTRAGSFQVDGQGRLVTSQGYEVQPGITIPDSTQSITIARDGTVEAVIAGQSGTTTVGSLQLADFINPGGLEARGGNLYMETVASGTPQIGTPGLQGLGALNQGMLEGSNVNVVEELVSMIEAQRAYEMNSKAISTADQMMQFVNNNL